MGAVPSLGQHTGAILGSSAFDAATIARFAREGMI